MQKQNHRIVQSEYCLYSYVGKCLPPPLSAPKQNTVVRLGMGMGMRRKLNTCYTTHRFFLTMTGPFNTSTYDNNVTSSLYSVPKSNQCYGVKILPRWFQRVVGKSSFANLAYQLPNAPLNHIYKCNCHATIACCGTQRSWTLNPLPRNGLIMLT